jgi:aryl-alcohol dehydrogenase-like predicted oxidoreductase
MHTTELGSSGPRVSRVGLGCMGMSDLYGPADRAESIGVLAHGTDIVPLIGARRRDRLREALGALTLDLTPADLARLEAAVPPEAVAGERYHPSQMAHLDSELG